MSNLDSLRRPIDVLDQLAKLADWWAHNAYAPLVGKEFSVNDLGQQFAVQTTDEVVARRRGERLSSDLPVPFDRYMAVRLAHSDAIFVTTEIVNRLWTFARQFASAEPLLPTDLPCIRGYAWLETPGYIQEVRGRMCSIRAYMWSAESDGLFLATFNDRTDPLDELTQEMRQTHRKERLPTPDQVEPRTPLLGWQVFPWGSTIRSSDESYFDHENITPGRRDGFVPDAGLIDIAAHDSLTMHRFWLALFEFMNERVSATASPDRAMRRRLDRTKTKTRDVKIVDLRALAHNPRPVGDHEPGKVAWTHRWPSRSHKRTYINRETGEVRKIVDVAGSIKGPKDKPLIMKKTVLRVKR